MIGGSKSYTLLYRATRDGFQASSFHSKCDGKANTITIIKTTQDYVFGGFTAAAWDMTYTYKTDSTAFLFALRQAGSSKNDKFSITMSSNAIYCAPYYGPVFGGGHDIFVPDNADVNTGDENCHSYQCPYGNVGYLTGGIRTFIASEIEVHQIN